MANTRTSLTKYTIAFLTVSLFFGFIFFSFEKASVNYDLSDFDNSFFEDYGNLTEGVGFAKDTAGGVNATQTDTGLFDVIGNLISSALKPFRDAIGGMTLMISSTKAMLGNLGILDIFSDYIVAVVVMLIFVGIFLFRVFLKTEDIN